MATLKMLRIGIAGATELLNERLEHLAALGVRHLRFGPPLGPDILAARQRAIMYDCPLNLCLNDKAWLP